MNRKTTSPAALEGVRVLDLTDQKGVYCTKLLADLGADVIRIEPPGGNPMRSIGPFFHDEPHPEKSLYWWHFNTNKRSITLNLDTAEGRKILKRLLMNSEIMVETFRPRELRSMGLGYRELKKLNQGLIVTSITGFGQTGPWKDWKTSDIVGLALSGLLNICGWPDRPPERMGGSQAYFQVSVQAAVGTLIALNYRAATGKGQHVDVSMQQSLPVCLQNAAMVYERTKAMRKRLGDRPQFPLGAFGVFPCKDGYVDIRPLLPHWERLVGWLDSEGMAADLKDEKWNDPFYRVEPANIRHVDEVIRLFLIKHSKMEIYGEGQRRGIITGPVYSAEDVVKDPQLQARHFFISVDHGELGACLTYLGAPYRLSETPWRIARRAPLVGEHNLEIYEGELGFSRQEVICLKQAGII